MATRIPPSEPVSPKNEIKIMAKPINLYIKRVPPLVPIFSSAQELLPKFSTNHSVFKIKIVPTAIARIEIKYFIMKVIGYQFFVGPVSWLSVPPRELVLHPLQKSWQHGRGLPIIFVFWHENQQSNLTVRCLTLSLTHHIE